MSLQFTTTEAAVEQTGVKVLVYGESGLGKTVLAATMGDNSVLLSAEAGMLSLKRRNLERLFGAGNPSIAVNMPVIQIHNVQDLIEAHQLLASPASTHIKNVGLDSISEIAEVVLNNAKRQSRDPRQAYGELLEKMESVIRAFRDLPGKNVYMAAKAEPMRDELTGVVKYGPSMPGSKLGPKLPYFFDEVFALRINKDPQGREFRYLQCQPDIQFVAKDRSGALAAMEPPHLGQLFAKIQGA
jgi:hypothetical protein